MISPKLTRFTKVLPQTWVSFCVKKIADGLLKKYANITIEGKENLNGLKYPVIFVCNHLSNSDGLVLSNILKEQDPTFVAGVKLSNNSTTNLGIAIVKTTPIIPNAPDKDGISKILQILKTGGNIFIFPEGTRSRTSSMAEAKKGILLIAKLAKVPIVPIGICGTEKLLPINPDGDMAAEKFGYADVRVNIGKQFAIPSKEAGEDKLQYEQRVLSLIMRSIAELIPEQYRGIYR